MAPKSSMFGILRKILAGKPGAQPSAIVTTEKIRHVFAFGTKHNLSGLSLPESEVQGLGRIIGWQAKAQDWTIKVAIKGFKLGDKIIIPPHIKWSANPLFAYVGIVDGAVEFRCGNDKASAWFLCPKAEQSDDIRKIEAIFQFWYRRLGLPESLDADAPQPDFSRTITKSDTPIRGFKVLSLRYPNLVQTDSEPFTARDLATRLSREMDVEWFGHTPDLTHFAVTEVLQGTGDHEDAQYFHFGPYEGSADAFISRHAVIVRETAGGGLMLLVQDTGVEHGPTIANLFDKIIESQTSMNS